MSAAFFRTLRSLATKGYKWNVSYCQSSAKIDDIAAFIR